VSEDDSTWEVDHFDYIFKSACKKAKAALKISEGDLIALHTLGRYFTHLSSPLPPLPLDVKLILVETGLLSVEEICESN